MISFLAFFKRPLNITVVFLVLLYGLAHWAAFEGWFFLYSELIRVASLTAGFFLPQYGLYWLHKTPKPQIQNLLITLFILLLLVDRHFPWYTMAGLGLTTAIIKTVFRLNRQPLFNPASAGLWVGSTFGLAPSWWGVSFAPYLTNLNLSFAMVLTLPFGLYLCYRYRKLPTVLTAVLTFALVYWLLNGRAVFYLLFEGTLAFFLLIMVVEPKTSPVMPKQQGWYGGSVGVLLALLLILKSPLFHLNSLLLANAGFRAYQYWSRRKMLMAKL